MGTTKKYGNNTVPRMLTKIIISLTLVLVLIAAVSGLMLLYVWML